MLLGNLGLLAANPVLFLRITVVTALALLVAITVHEASHALIATWQGDNTAKSYGRLSLNPLRHLDAMGTLSMVLVGFGWGKPVPVNPYWLRNGPKAGGAMVALAGPAANLLTAALVAAPVRLGLLASHSPFGGFRGSDPASILADLAAVVFFYNVILAVFNLIPLAPLDGFRVALGLLPMQQARSFARLEAYGPGLLMSILLLSYLPGINFGLRDILDPMVRSVSFVLLGRSSL